MNKRTFKPYWQDSTRNMPTIPEGQDNVQIIYRTAEDGTRCAIVNVVPQMIESIGKWQHICAIFQIDNWTYVNTIL